MAVTRFGDAGPVFGITAESFGYIQEFNQKHLADEVTAEDQQGATVTVAYYNPRYEGSFSVINNATGALPSIFTAATIANLSGISKAIITEVDRKPEQKGFQKTSFTYKAWESITLS